MADIGYDEGAIAQGRGAVVQRLANLSGAAVSLTLIGGLALWGYELLARDVSGVPVIQAMDGAFRIAPAEPGGMTTPHQGLAVNEIAAVGSAAGPAEEVRLAPPAATLAEDDAAAAELVPEIETAEVFAPGSDADAELAGADDPSDDGGTLAIAEAAPGDDGPAEVGIAIDDAPGDALAIDRAVAEALAGVLAPEPAVADAGSLPGFTLAAAMSPRPAPRPAPIRPAVEVVPARVERAAPQAAEVAAGELAPGTPLAQLGAFSNVAIARAEWGRIGAVFADSFDGKRRVIQRAQAGGRIFYRLRAEGFDDLADARRFCSALSAGGAECIPVELR